MIRSPAGFDGGDRIKRYLDYYQPSYGVMMLSAGQAFSPTSLFASGEIGAWYDPSDLTTMFQDSAGTTPVTAVGQAVGLILDKSGNGNHASQSTAAARPTYQSSGGLSWLSFDGTDDFLVTGTINPGSVDKAQVFAGVRKLSDGASGLVAETFTSSSPTGRVFNLFAPNGALPNYGIGLVQDNSTYNVGRATSFAAPITNVIAGLFDWAGSSASDKIKARVNGTSPTFDLAANFNGTLTAGNFASRALYVGRRDGTSFPFNGHLYSLILRFSAANLDAATIASTETWVASKTGVTL